jgi:hypothetical protein
MGRWAGRKERKNPQSKRDERSTCDNMREVPSGVGSAGAEMVPGVSRGVYEGAAEGGEDRVGAVAGACG